MKRFERRERDGQWAELELTIEDGRLSMTQTSGVILDQAAAEQQALDSWTDYFHDKETRDELALRARKFFDTPLEAAQYVVATDGALHGMEVHDRQDGKVYVSECSGRPTAEWFPEAVPHAKWHLNDMNAGCEHQDELAWGRGRDIALDRASCTPAQLAALDGAAERLSEQIQKRVVEAALVHFQQSPENRKEVMAKVLGRPPTGFDLNTAARAGTKHKGARAYFELRAAEKHPPVPFRSQVFADCLGAPCPTCGTLYGAQWYRRELPADTVAWATTFGAGVTEPPQTVATSLQPGRNST